MTEVGIDTFRALVDEDPLFSAEGMDLENVSGAVDEIEDGLHTLEEAYAGESFSRRLFFIRYPLARYAVPVPFLRSFIESERSRRKYLADDSPESAQELLRSWDSASRDYSQSVKRYRTLHTILLRLESDGQTFVMQDMFGYSTSFRHVEKFLGMLSQNAEELKRLVQERLALHAKVGHPRKSSASAGALLSPLEKTSISPWHARIHAAEIAGEVSPFRYVDILETYGPFSFTLPNFDKTPQAHAFMFYILRDKKTLRKSMWLARVDRFHFSNPWKVTAKQDGITRGKYATAVGLSPEDVPYWYESSTHFYNSRDQAYWVEIATRIDLARRPELNKSLVCKQKSSTFDLLLAECARDIRSMVGHLRRRARSKTSTSYSMLYDLLTRSFPNMYYLTFNGSVWRLPESPHFLGDGFVAADFTGHLSESEAQARLTPEVLKKVMGVQKLREERGRAGGWLT